MIFIDLQVRCSICHKQFFFEEREKHICAFLGRSNKAKNKEERSMGIEVNNRLDYLLSILSSPQIKDRQDKEKRIKDTLGG